MARSVLVIGLAVAIAVAGALAWPDRSGSVGLPPASRDAGADATAVLQEEAGAPEFAAVSPEAGAPFGREREKEDEEDDPALRLPVSSPKTVRFGVILVQYRGAEVAVPATRSRGEAFALARSLAQAAKTDFKNQVDKGDPGSMEDAGRIPRGVLEPSVEYALFTLKPGEVSDPIDTPRGFWIVKRIE